MNKIIRKLMAKFRIKYNLSLLYYSQSNRLMKRFNKILYKEIIKLIKEIKS